MDGLPRVGRGQTCLGCVCCFRQSSIELLMMEEEMRE
jgi:hypothetical protein